MAKKKRGKKTYFKPTITKPYGIDDILWVL